MKKILLSLKIRIKLLLAFGSIIALSVLLIIFSFTSINKIIHHKAIDESLDHLALQWQTLNLAVKNFMYEEYKSEAFLKRNESMSVAVVDSSYARSIELINNISYLAVDDSVETNKLAASLRATLDSVHVNFYELVSLLRRRGFKDCGLEGSLREAIHAVENSGFVFNRASMLTLRRHEKDFFLRKDLKYQNEFNRCFDAFYSDVEPLLGDTLRAALRNYKERFNNVVEIEKQIGLTENSGIRGEIQTSFARMIPMLDTFRKQTKEINEAQIADTKLFLWIIFSIQIVVGLVMALVYSNLLTKSIKEIRFAIQKLADGFFPQKLVVRTTEEIGQTKLAFNQFIDRLRSATRFAEQLGNGELNANYEAQYAGDVLAMSLISAQHKLRDAEARQHKINWTNEGIAKFNIIFNNEDETIDQLSDQILALLVKYVKANKGVLYLHQRSNEMEALEPIASYAGEGMRFISKHFAIGEGMVGQCFVDGQTIFLKEVPRDFVKITSGLGAAIPRNIIITPLKVRSVVIGVIEIASFQVMEDFEINFIERVAESAATLIANRKHASETKDLLERVRQGARQPVIAAHQSVVLCENEF